MSPPNETTSVLFPMQETYTSSAATAAKSSKDQALAMIRNPPRGAPI